MKPVQALWRGVIYYSNHHCKEPKKRLNQKNNLRTAKPMILKEMNSNTKKVQTFFFLLLTYSGFSLARQKRLIVFLEVHSKMNLENVFLEMPFHSLAWNSTTSLDNLVLRSFFRAIYFP